MVEHVADTSPIGRGGHRRRPVRRRLRQTTVHNRHCVDPAARDRPPRLRDDSPHPTS